MEIIRAKRMGFCFGVRKAVEICEKLKDVEGRKYILGMLVHNKDVVEKLTKAGFLIVTEEEILENKDNLQENDIVVVRAHGTEKNIFEALEQRKVNIFDATCIFVKKIKEILIDREKEEDKIIFIGDKEHPEVKGIISYGKNILIFKSLEELKSYELDENIRYSVLTQTTLNKNKFIEIERYLEKHYPKIQIFDRICGATSERQQATEELSKVVDLMLVVGDVKSSNSRKLLEVALSNNQNSYLIQNEKELKEEILENVEKIGLAAGASTPEETILKIENKIRGILMYNENNNYDEFEALLNEYMPVKETEEMKKRVKGTIVSKDRNYTYLDVQGEPSAVRVRTEELVDFEIGNEVEVMILSKMEEDDTLVLIASKRRIDMEAGLEKIKAAFEAKEVLVGKIVKHTKGGYIVEVMYQQCFLPNSLSEIPFSMGESYVGKEIDFVVREMKEDKRGTKILVSRKEIVAAKENEKLEKVSVGEVVTATIKEVLDFGLVVDVTGVKGFVHISEIDWRKTSELKSKFEAGQEITAKIIEKDIEKRNLKLSIKELTRNPWKIVAEEYSVGSVVDGKVVRISNYGAFVEILPGVEGLVHISDFSWVKKKVNINSFVKVGDDLKVLILELDSSNRKLKLGIKQLSSNPWEDATSKFAVGNILKGKVVEVKAFGIFVEVEEGVDGFIHNTDFAWTGNKKYSKGDEVEFKVVELNTADQKIKGSIKDLEKSPWAKAMENYKVGNRIEAPVKNIQDFGMFVKLEEGVDGFVPTQMASREFLKSLKQKFNVGDVVRAEIVEIDSAKQRIKLSIKKVEIEAEKEENKELLEKYGTSSSEE